MLTELSKKKTVLILTLCIAQSTGAVEYTDCTSNKCPGYDTKQSDGEAPGMLEL